MNRRNGIILALLSLTLISISAGLYLRFRLTPYEMEMEKAYSIKNAYPEKKIFDGYVEPPIPIREESEKTLLGTDANKNGLRDDVEIWINRTQNDSDIRNGLRQLHYAYQEVMKVKVVGQSSLDGSPVSVESMKEYESFQMRAAELHRNFERGEACLDLFIKKSQDEKLIENFNSKIQNRNKLNLDHFLRVLNQAIGVGISHNTEWSFEERKKIYCKWK